MVSDPLPNTLFDDPILDATESRPATQHPPPVDAPTVTEAVEQYQRAGHSGAMAFNEDATLHCYACQRDLPLADVVVLAVTSAHTPVDGHPAAVVAARCPACASAGVLVLDVGPLANPAEVRAAEKLGVVGP